MFGLFRKKKLLSEVEQEDKVKADLEEELEKERKRERKKEKKGPNWAAVLILGVSILAATTFWIYGKLSSGGFTSADFSHIKFENSEDSDPEPGKNSSNDVIIFEK